MCAAIKRGYAAASVSAPAKLARKKMEADGHLHLQAGCGVGSLLVMIDKAIEKGVDFD